MKGDWCIKSPVSLFVSYILVRKFDIILTELFREFGNLNRGNEYGENQ
ncbi:Uncharacterized [Syntrophomonas zehnderi OL-4]|uniref:Uncharacterized n=1 Tax=Syntrophomonas zehnderi OL-4 TaxID=690567 RepID=A0A0E4GDU9_9FIRM|nr:Uncharacterized [Syntrophomonas zehnderi OL-4]